MRVVPSVLSYAWAAPASAVGLAFAAIAGALGAKIDVVDGILEVGGGALCRAAARAGRFDAITIGHVVIGTSCEALAACRAHEQVHVRQYERWGALFFPLYLGSSLVALARGCSPYRHNHFEEQAFRTVARTERGIA